MRRGSPRVFYGCAPRLLAPPRRAQEAKFYAGDEGESMRVELRLRVMAVATPTRLTLTALVGKPLNAIILIISGVGYKRRIGVPQSPSASPPAPDSRTLHFRLGRIATKHARSLHYRFWLQAEVGRHPFKVRCWMRSGRWDVRYHFMVMSDPQL